ncbi:MAG: glycosyltransferase family 1 protein [Chloroflexi bacterium]|nr:glycosyltransferase family 1 protein [Chloroflexota bacterium]MDL1884014.1 glycosyltransferase family 4 protein [Anaerolineae bacterium CFX8]
MHIVFNGWFWDQPHTGSGQYIRCLLHALGRAAPDVQMTLVLPPHNSAPDDLPENVSLVTTRGSGGHVGKVWFEQRTFPQMAGRVRADIAHVPYWGPPLASPVPLVTSVLDVIPLALPEYSRGLGARLYTSLAAAAARGSAHTITLSQAAKADIVRFLGLPEDSITPIYLAADEVYHPRLGAENDQAVRRKYDLPEQFVLYLGGFDRRKNVNQLLLAYTYVGQAEGDNIPLVIAGREPQWGAPLFPDQRRYAADLDISDYVRWLGYVDEADKPALYRLASVFAFPTLYEGFGLMALEAMACGTPVVANNIPVMAEITGDAAYLVKPDDAREMAGAIIALLLQKPLRDSLVNLGLARATHFSWRKTARQTLEVYERVLAAR